MAVQLSAEQETRLTHLATLVGRNVDELTREAVDRFLADEDGFHNTVLAGREAAERGDFLDTSEVWASVEQELQA